MSHPGMKCWIVSGCICGVLKQFKITLNILKRFKLKMLKSLVN